MSRDFPLYNYSMHLWAEHVERVPRNAWKDAISETVLSLLQPTNGVFSFWRYYVRNYECPLYYTAERGYLQLCELLLKDGKEDINKIGGHCGTALNIACMSGYTDVVQFLIENGADPYLGNERRKCALDPALRGSNEAVVKLLLKQPEVLKHCEKINFFPLVCALRSYSGVNILKILLQKGADPNGHEEGNGSALLIAVENCDLDAVKLLLEHGADPLFRFGAWKNCVQAAVCNVDEVTDSISIIKDLLLHGAQVDPPDEEWDNWINEYWFTMADRQNLEALQKVCGEMSRIPDGFTEENIDAYMDKLGKALEYIWENDDTASEGAEDEGGEDE